MAATRNQETLETLVTALEGNGGDRLNACFAAGVSVGWLKRWMSEDPLVARAIEDAIDTGTSVIESHAMELALGKLQEDVYYQGEVVGQKAVLNPGMTQFMLKARMPEVYNPTQKHELTGAGGQALFAGLSDQELDERIEQLRRDLHMAQLPLTLEGEFETVPPGLDPVDEFI